MHQNDLAHWLLTLLQSGKAGDAYNVGSDEAVSIAELAYLVRDTLSPQKKVQINGELLADNVNRSRYIPDILKAQNELGLKVTVPLADAIRLSVPGYMRLK
jgi:dTDP-glucose 4,6-dehydratase